MPGSWFPGLDAQFAELRVTNLTITGMLRSLNDKVKHMALDLSKLLEVVATIKTDVAKTGTDVQAIVDKLGAVTTTDPAVQTAIDSAVADLGGVRDALEAVNAKAETAGA